MAEVEVSNKLAQDAKEEARLAEEKRLKEEKEMEI